MFRCLETPSPFPGKLQFISNRSCCHSLLSIITHNTSHLCFASPNSFKMKYAIVLPFMASMVLAAPVPGEQHEQGGQVAAGAQHGAGVQAGANAQGDATLPLVGGVLGAPLGIVGGLLHGGLGAGAGGYGHGGAGGYGQGGAGAGGQWQGT